MIISGRSFPHPVLSPFNDDVLPNTFDFTVKSAHDKDFFYLDCLFGYENKTIEGMIRECSAIHVVHVECKRNYYRVAHAFVGRQKLLSIPTSQVMGGVEITGLVRAKLAKMNYSIEGSHPDYGGRTFHIRPSDYLAVGKTWLIDAYVDYDPLAKITSILRIEESQASEDGKMEFDTTDDMIIATLSKNDYARYTNLRLDPKLIPIVVNQVAVPVVQEAIEQIMRTQRGDWEDEMSKRWFRSIVKRFEKQGIDLRKCDKPAIDLVQQVLDSPLRRSLQGLLEMNPVEDDL